MKLLLIKGIFSLKKMLLDQFSLLKGKERKCIYANQRHFPGSIYFFKINNRNSRKRCEICQS